MRASIARDGLREARPNSLVGKKKEWTTSGHGGRTGAEIAHVEIKT